MTQHRITDKKIFARCELLSNLYLCIGWHSTRVQAVNATGVVNCFQICIFVSDDTAWCGCGSYKDLLWIAFKFVSLYRMTQQPQIYGARHRGCELLSNLYLCIGWHSQAAASLMGTLLWIAFKFVSLYRMTQQIIVIKIIVKSCELLSNLYLCIGWHSCSDMSELTQPVVNCFQICIFVSDDTA